MQDDSLIFFFVIQQIYFQLSYHHLYQDYSGSLDFKNGILLSNTFKEFLIKQVYV